MPPEFWWAEGDEALEQNWTAGDFSTSVGTDVWVQAFGVTFALSGMLELLAPEKRALAARQLSVAGNPAWMTARAARAFAFEKAGVGSTKAASVVLDQAGLGFVTTRAVLAQRFLPGQYGVSLDALPDWEEREWDIPDWFWRDFKVTKRTSFDWERGIFSGEGPWRKGQCLMKLSGVHFLAESLQSLLLASAVEGSVVNSAAGTSSKSKGGRPPQPWWDDMWCAVTSAIIHGSLIPKRQSDVENAMLTWAAVNGHEISQTAVKPKAKKLFEAYENQVTNFLDGGL